MFDRKVDEQVLGDDKGPPFHVNMAGQIDKVLHYDLVKVPMSMIRVPMQMRLFELVWLHENVAIYREI